MSAPVALPSVPLAPTPPGGAAASPVVIVVDGVAQALAALAAATQLAGTVAPGISAGELTLLTVLGALSIKSPLTLTPGTRLVLQALPGRPDAAIIVTINDLPTTVRAAAPTSPAPGALPAPPLAPPSFLALGMTVTATIIGAAEPALPTAPPTVAQAEGKTAPASGAAMFPLPAAPRAASPAVERPNSPAPPGLAKSSPPAGATVTPATASPPIAATRNPASAPMTMTPQARAGASDNLSGGSGATATDTAPRATAPVPPPSDTPRFAAPGTTVTLRILAVQPGPVPGSLETPALRGIVKASPERAGETLVETPAGVLRLFGATYGATGQRGAPPLPPGTPVALRLIAGSPAAALLTVLVGEPSPPQSPPLRADGQGAAGATAPPEQPVYRVLLGDPGSRQPAGTVTPQPVIGTVLSSHAATPTLITTPFGTLAVSERLALPPGTLLLLAIQEDGAAPDVAPTASPSHLEKGWSALEATLGTLAQAAPNLAAHLRADFSTQSGERLALGLMFLVASLRNGGGRAWPGEAIEHALTMAGRGDLKLRLGEEFADIRGIADNPATSPWQVFLLPLVDGAAVRPVRLYLKRRGERGRRGASDDNARFVLEFEMTRLGTMQLDGFVRPRRFDLILRSHATLTAPLRAAVEVIFRDRIAAAGLAGTIDFSTTARFDVAPLDGLRAKIGLAV